MSDSDLNRFRSSWVRKLGFIDYNGHLEVHSSLLNVVLHDQPQILQAPVDEPPMRDAPRQAMGS